MVNCGGCGAVLMLTDGRYGTSLESFAGLGGSGWHDERTYTCICGHETTIASGGLIPEPAKKPKAEPDETIQGLLVGVREFRVNEHGYLHSLVHGGAWSPDKPQQATCAKSSRPFDPYSFHAHWPYYDPPEPHAAPDFDCECGFYGFTSLEEADKAGDGFQFPQRIRAVVSAWGDVVLCEHGFRSEWMQIEAIVQQPTFAWGVEFDASKCWRKIADRYGVPVVDATDVDEFWKSVGVVVDAKEERDRAAKRAADERWCAQDDFAQRLAKILDDPKDKRSKPAFWRDRMNKKGPIYGE